MLFKLSLKNIRKSIKDYAIYFVTLILGVAVFYVFNSMDSQQVMTDISASTKDIIKLMINMLSGVSVFISCVLAFLIVYANNFLIKRRKKEFGVYMTLGMGKGQISRILVGETFLIGMFSLAVGLVVGILGAQFMSVLVVKMFEANMESYVFVFSKAAFFKTILYFGIMYVAVLVLNTFSISRCTLNELLAAGKKNEQIKVKNKTVCVILFLCSLVLLSVLYYLVAVIPEQLDISNIGVVIALGCVGTFVFFWSLSGFLLGMMQKRKRFYLRDLNAFVLRQINSKINTTVFAMSIICIMLFMTITVLSSGLGINQVFRDSLKEMTPVDVNVFYYPPAGGDVNISVSKKLEEEGFDLSMLKPGSVDMGVYETEQLTVLDTFGEDTEKVSQNYAYVQPDTPETILRLSDYNRLARMYHQKEYELKNNEYIVLCDMDNMLKKKKKRLASRPEITVGGQTFEAKYDKCQSGFMQMMTNHVNTGIYLLPDSAVPEEWRASGFLASDYQAQSQQGIDETDAAFARIPGESGISSNTKSDIIAASVGLTTIVTFVAIYLGIVFLVTGAAILALKELSESSDNRERYEVLRKIGADEKMINYSLMKQVGVFFFLPLGLACVHSVFGLQFVKKIMYNMGNITGFGSILTTALILLVIYGGYFLVTYLGSKRIIRGK